MEKRYVVDKSYPLLTVYKRVAGEQIDGVAYTVEEVMERHNATMLNETTYTTKCAVHRYNDMLYVIEVAKMARRVRSALTKPNVSIVAIDECEIKVPHIPIGKLLMLHLNDKHFEGLKYKYTQKERGFVKDGNITQNSMMWLKAIMASHAAERYRDITGIRLVQPQAKVVHNNAVVACKLIGIKLTDPIIGYKRLSDGTAPVFNLLDATIDLGIRQNYIDIEHTDEAKKKLTEWWKTRKHIQSIL